MSGESAPRGMIATPLEHYRKAEDLLTMVDGLRVDNQGIGGLMIEKAKAHAALANVGDDLTRRVIDAYQRAIQGALRCLVEDRGHTVTAEDITEAVAWLRLERGQ